MYLHRDEILCLNETSSHWKSGQWKRKKKRMRMKTKLRIVDCSTQTVGWPSHWQVKGHHCQIAAPSGDRSLKNGHPDPEGLVNLNVRENAHGKMNKGVFMWRQTFTHNGGFSAPRLPTTVPSLLSSRRPWTLVSATVRAREHDNCTSKRRLMIDWLLMTDCCSVPGV